jgi:hypothetical protein
MKTLPKSLTIVWLPMTVLSNTRAEALFGREQTAVGYFAFIRVRRFNHESKLMFQNTAIAPQ